MGNNEKVHFFEVRFACQTERRLLHCVKLSITQTRQKFWCLVVCLSAQRRGAVRGAVVRVLENFDVLQIYL